MSNSVTNRRTEWLQVVVACIVLLSVGALAQTPQSIWLQHPDLNTEKQKSPVHADPSQEAAGQAVSIARLRVPHKARELYQKAEKTFLKHEYAEAQQKLNQALQQYPAYPEALTMSGYIQMDTNQWSSAERSLQAAVRSDQTFALAFLVLSELYNRERRFDDALAVSQRAVQLIPNAWSAKYQTCRALIGKHQYELALNVSEAALRGNRGTLLHIAKAHALLGLGRYAEAATELRIYLQYQPTGEGSQDAHDLLAKIQNAYSTCRDCR